MNQMKRCNTGPWTFLLSYSSWKQASL